MAQTVSVSQHLTMSAEPIVNKPSAEGAFGPIGRVDMLDGTLALQSSDPAVLREIGEAFLEAASRLEAVMAARPEQVSA